MKKYLLALLFALSSVAAPAQQITVPVSSSSSTSAAMRAPYVINLWYPAVAPAASAASTSSAGVAGSIYCSPFVLESATGQSGVTLSGLAVRVITLSAGNGNLALGGAIYKADPLVGNRPGAILGTTASFVNFTTSAAATVSATLGTPVAMPFGAYWFCVQTFDVTVTYAALTVGNLGGTSALIGSATASTIVGTSTVTSVSTTGVFGTWPATLNGSVWTENAANARAPVGAILFSAVN